MGAHPRYRAATYATKPGRIPDRRDTRVVADRRRYANTDHGQHAAGRCDGLAGEPDQTVESTDGAAHSGCRDCDAAPDRHAHAVAIFGGPR